MPPCVTLQTPKPVGDPGLMGNLQWLEIPAACLHPTAGPQPSQSLCRAVTAAWPARQLPTASLSSPRCTGIPRCSAPWLHSTPLAVARRPAPSPSRAIPRPSLHHLARGNMLGAALLKPTASLFHFHSCPPLHPHTVPGTAKSLSPSGLPYCRQSLLINSWKAGKHPPDLPSDLW